MESINDTKGIIKLPYRDKVYNLMLSMDCMRLLAAKFEISLSNIEITVKSDPINTIGKILYCGMLSETAYLGEEFNDTYDAFCSVAMRVSVDQIDSWTDNIFNALVVEDEDMEPIKQIAETQELGNAMAQPESH